MEVVGMTQFGTLVDRAVMQAAVPLESGFLVAVVGTFKRLVPAIPALSVALWLICYGAWLIASDFEPLPPLARIQ